MYVVADAVLSMLFTLLCMGCCSTKLITKYQNVTWSVSCMELTHGVCYLHLDNCHNEEYKCCTFPLFFPTVVV